MRDPRRDAIERELVVEREGWASERVARMTERLQVGTPAAERLETLVVWIEDEPAFTGPGRTIYVGRRLLERLVDDDAAFVVGHELAHHRPPGWLSSRRRGDHVRRRAALAGAAGAALAATLLALGRRR